MVDSKDDGFPSLEENSEYLIPGPGMSAVNPWLLPRHEPATEPPKASKPPESAPQSAQRTEATAPPAAEQNGGSAAKEVQVKREAPAERPQPASQPPSNGKDLAGPSVGLDGDLPPFLYEELAPILASAQQAAAQIVDRAKAKARAETVEMERARVRLEARMEELAAWHEQLEPMIVWFQEKMEEIRARIDEVPEMIRNGLDPLASAVSTVDPALSEMTAASRRLLTLEPLPRRLFERSERASQ